LGGFLGANQFFSNWFFSNLEFFCEKNERKFFQTKSFFFPQLSLQLHFQTPSHDINVWRRVVWWSQKCWHLRQIFTWAWNSVWFFFNQNIARFLFIFFPIASKEFFEKTYLKKMNEFRRNKNKGEFELSKKRNEKLKKKNFVSKRICWEKENSGWCFYFSHFSGIPKFFFGRINDLCLNQLFIQKEGTKSFSNYEKLKRISLSLTRLQNPKIFFNKDLVRIFWLSVTQIFWL